MAEKVGAASSSSSRLSSEHSRSSLKQYFRGLLCIAVLLVPVVYIQWSSKSFIILSMIMAALTALGLAYQATLAKIPAISRFRDDSWIKELLAGRFLTTVISLLVGMAVSPAVLVIISGYDAKDWLLLSLALGLSIRLANGVGLLELHLKSSYAQPRRFLLACLVPAYVVGFARILLSEPGTTATTLLKSVTLRDGDFIHLQASPLASTIAKWLVLWEQSLNLFITRMPDLLAWTLKLITALDFATPCLLVTLMYCSLPWCEARRLFVPLGKPEAPITGRDVGWWAFGLTLALVGIYLPTLASFQQNLIIQVSGETTADALEKQRKRIIETADGVTSVKVV